jgi:hypothetical protein
MFQYGKVHQLAQFNVHIRITNFIDPLAQDVLMMIGSKYGW